MRCGGFRGDLPGCLLLGLRHGSYCVGCCWVLMALLFVGGVMNVLWIALLATANQPVAANGLLSAFACRPTRAYMRIIGAAEAP
jgi:predicted metal-binding membrane protein